MKSQDLFNAEHRFSIALNRQASNEGWQMAGKNPDLAVQIRILRTMFDALANLLGESEILDPADLDAAIALRLNTEAEAIEAVVAKWEAQERPHQMMRSM